MPALHWSFQGEQVLLPFLVLDSFLKFILATLLTVLICVLERFLTVANDKHWEPQFLKLSRRCLALWRTWVYSMITFLRICCVLILITFHIGIICVVILTLATAQFFIELQNLPNPPKTSSQHHQSILTRPRSRSKPDDIFIHPAESNIARADVFALELGIGSETERVRNHLYNKEASAWKAGTGRDHVRTMLAGQQIKPPIGSEHEPFLNDAESD